MLWGFTTASAEHLAQFKTQINGGRWLSIPRLLFEKRRDV